MKLRNLRNTSIVIFLLGLPGCMAIGMVQDAIDEPRHFETTSDFEIATTRFNRNDDFIGFMFGKNDIWVAPVGAGNHVVRDRYLLPGDGLKAAQDELKLVKLTTVTACPSGGHKKALIYIHGYWAMLSKSMESASSVSRLVDAETQVYLLSWPAGTYLNGNTTYQWSTWSAGLASEDLRRVLAWVARCHNSSDISVIAHSKGAHVALSLFLDERLSDEFPAMGNLILVSPDHSFDDFRSRVKTVADTFKNVYVVQENGDLIVELGGLLDWYPRESLGVYSAGSPTGMPTNVSFLVAHPDAKTLEKSGLEAMLRTHTSYIWHAAVREELCRILVDKPLLSCPPTGDGYRQISGSDCAAVRFVEPVPACEQTVLGIP